MAQEVANYEKQDVQALSAMLLEPNSQLKEAEVIKLLKEVARKFANILSMEKEVVGLGKTVKA